MAAFYTTRDVARLLGVTTVTVINWTRKGLLPVAHRTVGGHRRISRSDLETFCGDQGIALPEFESRPKPASGGGEGTSVVLVVDPDPQFLAVARDFLEAQTGFRVEVAQDGFTGGMLVGLLCPDVLVVSEDHPDFDLTKIVAAVETIRGRKPMKLVACTALQDEFREQALLGLGFDAVVQKTMGWTNMAALFRTLV